MRSSKAACGSRINVDKEDFYSGNSICTLDSYDTVRLRQMKEAIAIDEIPVKTFSKEMRWWKKTTSIFFAFFSSVLNPLNLFCDEIFDLRPQPDINVQSTG